MRGVGGDRVHGYDLDVQIVEGGEKSEKLRLIGHAAHQPRLITSCHDDAEHDEEQKRGHCRSVHGLRHYSKEASNFPLVKCPATYPAADQRRLDGF